MYWSIIGKDTQKKKSYHITEADRKKKHNKFFSRDFKYDFKLFNEKKSELSEISYYLLYITNGPENRA